MFILYNMSEVSYNRIGTDGFEVKSLVLLTNNIHGLLPFGVVVAVAVVVSETPDPVYR